MADFFIGDAAFAVAIGFLAGILAASFGWPIFYASGAFVAAGILAAIISHRKKFFYAGIFSFAAVFLGAYYFYFFTAWRSANIGYRRQQGILFRSSFPRSRWRRRNICHFLRHSNIPLWEMSWYSCHWAMTFNTEIYWRSRPRFSRRAAGENLRRYSRNE